MYKRRRREFFNIFLDLRIDNSGVFCFLFRFRVFFRRKGFFR